MLFNNSITIITILAKRILLFFLITYMIYSQQNNRTSNNGVRLFFCLKMHKNYK